MEKTPYEILGVSPNATDDEIKEAYKALVKKYHPDKYAGSDLSDLATEKMKEINAAYEQIQNLRQNGGNAYGNTYGNNNGYQNTDDFAKNNSKNPFYNNIRLLINQGNYQEAENYLQSIPQASRDAEWYYLLGCVLVKKGFFADAKSMFDIACNKDPSNSEYRSAQQEMNNRMGARYNNYRRQNDAERASNICTSLICADCCCEMMGGDLIPCC